jgi:hypothetical protein
MGAGNLIGSVFTTIFFGGLWIVLGAAVDKIVKAFNTSIKVLPSMQDAVNGMSVMEWIWTILLVIVFMAIWINYLMNENSQASGGV